MIKRYFTLAALALFASGAYAQEQKSVLKLADEAYAREEYAVAGALYNRLAEKKNGRRLPTDRWQKMAHCYREIGQFRKAAAACRRLLERPDHPRAANFAYGEVLRQLSEYDSARIQYQAFATTNTDSLHLKTIAMQSCDSAVLWNRHPADVQLQPFNTFNTTGSDIVNSLTRQGALVMSNGYRPEVQETHRKDDKRVQKPYYKVYAFGPFAPDNGNLYHDELLPELFGKFDYHVGPVCMNATGDTLYATINIQGKEITNGVRELQIWQSIKTDGKWSALHLLPGINLAGYRSSHAVLSPSGDVLYFISNRPGSLGQTDIWYSEKQADGSWGAPQNCGSQINTVAEESFPVMQADGVLYFSSKGLHGFGGYDLYRTEGSKSNWGKPENLKAPVNSGADELAFIMQPTGNAGYFSSNREGGLGGDDVYSFLIRRNETLPAPGTPVVNDNRPSGPKKQEAPSTQSQSREDAADRQLVESLEIHYDYNSAALLAESRNLLDKLVAVLMRHPDWKLVVTSHADSRGSTQYNDDLSARRSLAVIKYLTSRGVNGSILFYNNFGERKPVNRCTDGVPCAESDYRANRRTTLAIR